MTKTIRELVNELSQEDYEALKTCITKGAGLILSSGMDEKEEIIADLEDAYNYPDGWVTPLRQMLENGELARIRQLAGELKKDRYIF